MMSCKQYRISLSFLSFCIQLAAISGVSYDRSSGGYTTVPGDIGTDATTIDLSQNSLTSIASSEFSSYTSLEVLYLSNNSITTISDNAFNGLTNVEEVYLDGNALTTYPDFQADLASSLLILDLSRNDISSIPGTVYYSFITDLYLARNPIDWTDGSLDGVVAYVGTVERLDLSSTGCTSSSQASGNFSHYFEVIDKLIINQCHPYRMITVPVLSQWISSIGEISLRKNELTTNDIEVSSITSFTSILYLYLNGNIMTTIPNLPTVLRGTILELDLMDNQIASIDWTLFEDYTALEILNLRGNNLATISGSAILPNLLQLNLRENGITEITEGIIANASNLQILDLRSNDLTTLSNISSATTSSLLTIYMENNPLVCDCDFSFILEASDAYLLYSNVRITLNTTPCASPSVFSSSDYTSLTTEAICVECQPFATWLDIELDTGEVIELGGEIQYVCVSGLDFEDNDERKSSTCSVSDGSWSPSFETCYEDYTEDANDYEDVKEAKNASIIGSLALIIVLCEVAFLLLLDSQHLHEAYHKLKNQFCSKGEKEHKHGHKHESSVHPDSTLLAVPSVESPMGNMNGSRSSFSALNRSHRSISIHGASTSFV